MWLFKPNALWCFLWNTGGYFTSTCCVSYTKSEGRIKTTVMTADNKKLLMTKNFNFPPTGTYR